MCARLFLRCLLTAANNIFPQIAAEDCPIRDERRGGLEIPPAGFALTLPEKTQAMPEPGIAWCAVEGQGFLEGGLSFIDLIFGKQQGSHKRVRSWVKRCNGKTFFK
jgi:hypothetical protein